MTIAPALPRSGPTTTCARVLAGVLRELGIPRVYCVAGESYLPLLDALGGLPDLDIVTCRHEGSAAFMALAEAKLTGRVGVCLVNRGPGATNAAIGVHSADQDATALLLIVGHVERSEMGRQAFQELDCARVFSGIAKAVEIVVDPSRAAEALVRAVRTAESGTPGPVVLVLPEDLLWAQIPAAVHGPLRWDECPGAPDPRGLTEVSELLGRCARPVLLAGGRLSTPAGRRALARAAEVLAVPVVVSNKHQDLLDNEHRCYAGHLHIGTASAQRELLAGADLVMAVGTRLDAVTTATHAFPGPPERGKALVHVHADPAQVGRVHRPTHGLVCDPVAFLEGLVARQPAVPQGRLDWIEQVHACEAALAAWTPHDAPDGVVFGAVVDALLQMAPAQLIVTVDAGNFTSWVHRYFRFSPCHRLLGIGSSAMGFGVPAGVAAALVDPAVRVVAFVGDGGFLMNGAELATAVERHASLIVVVANNGSYGTIRAHQERQFPGRVVATCLTNPDFARLAEAYGAIGITVRREGDLPTALARALATPGPVVVDVRTSLEWISAAQRMVGVGR